MASFTPHVEHKVRRWVGDKPDSPGVEEAWRFEGESVEAAALAILRRRRASLVLTGPAEWSVDGDYSQKFTPDQVKALDATIAQLETLCPDDPANDAGRLSVSYLERYGYCGR